MMNITVDQYSPCPNFIIKQKDEKTDTPGVDVAGWTCDR